EFCRIHDPATPDTCVGEPGHPAATRHTTSRRPSATRSAPDVAPVRRAPAPCLARPTPNRLPALRGACAVATAARAGLTSRSTARAAEPPGVAPRFPGVRT